MFKNIMDNTDFEILEMLKKNARSQIKNIAEVVHLSAPAVASRINRMEKSGVIKAYTVKIDEEKFSKSIQCFITVFMKNINHKEFQKMIINKVDVVEFHKISGTGCYLLKVRSEKQIKLNEILNDISLYGNYQVNISIDKLK